MKAKQGEEKLEFSLWPKYKKLCNILFGIFCGICFAFTVAALCWKEWVTAGVFGALGALFVAVWQMLRYGLVRRRIAFYPDRVVFWHERAWAWPSMEARYEDIRGACINKADEVGDHVTVKGRLFDFEVDTLCVYCKRGEYILFGLHGWSEKNSRRILDEILRRANAPESAPEKGEYGSGSEQAKRGFAELGAEEEPRPVDDPEKDRFDIAAIIGCELCTAKGVRVGKIVRVVPATTDIYIVERRGREMQLPAEEGVILGMDVEKKRMTVDADKFFAAVKEQE